MKGKKRGSKFWIGAGIVFVALIFGLTVIPVSALYEWDQVNEEGFGDLANDYAWSMHEYNGYIYVGTLNTDISDPPNLVTEGLEIWRSSTGNSGTWTNVVGSGGTQFPWAGFGSVCIGARGMEVSDGLLWVGTSNPFVGCQIWVTNGTHWKRANLPGFGSSSNIATRGITVYKGAVYAEAQNPSEGAGVWKYMGPTDFESMGTLENQAKWVQVNAPGFGEPEINSGIGELIPFDPPTDGAAIEYLYAGTWNGTGPQLIQAVFTMDFSALVGCQVWRTNGTVDPGDPPQLIWEKVMTGGFGDTQNGVILSSAVFNGNLYMGTQNFVDQAELWRTSDGLNWAPVTTTGFMDIDELDVSGLGNGYMWRMITYNNALFVGTLNPILGCQVWSSSTGAPGTFEQVNVNGMNGERTIPIVSIEGIPITGIDQYGVRSFAVFNDWLYLGTASWGDWVDRIIGTDYSEYVGCEVWRTDGTTYIPPELDVAKTVFDSEAGYWVDTLNVSIGDDVRFLCAMQNACSAAGMTGTVVLDILSPSLAYANGATLHLPNGTTIDREPDYVLIIPIGTYGMCTVLEWDLGDLLLEPGERVTIEYNANVIAVGKDINFLFAGGKCSETGEYGYGWDYAILLSGPSGKASDSTGRTKAVYDLGESVYAAGSGFVPNSPVDIYITEDRKWYDGTEINPPLFATKTVDADANGAIRAVEVWTDPSVGEYDIIFDANQNGIYNKGIDAVDDPNDPGFIVLCSVPALAPVGLIVLVGLLSVVVAISIRRKR